VKLMVVFGTRPEVIKIAAVIAEARRRTNDIELVVCSTGQHKEMLAQALAVFDLYPDIDLQLMQPNQTLAGLTSRLLDALTVTISHYRPDAVVVQGDTTSAFVGALAAFYQQVPVAHVEAGLRTGDLTSPFPEELNRVLIGRMARWHFPPTALSAANLLAEGVPPARVLVTGNTVVDAICMVRQRWASGTQPLPVHPFAGRRLVLVTAHRRENHGEALLQICASLKILCARHPELGFVFPVHLNPKVRDVVAAELGNIDNLKLMPPVDFNTSLYFQSQSCLVITDSGGLQEEAPSFAVPTVVMREHTERSEGIAAGFTTLAGTQTSAIIEAADRYLADTNLKTRLAATPNPYGDGQASRRIISAMLGESAEPFSG
jgi:UDP-N-acetylglucosamine 2-epimerase (non-hydrolysing)